MSDRINPHNFGYCCRYAANQSCIGCGDEENGTPVEQIELKKLIAPPHRGRIFSIVSRPSAPRPRDVPTRLPGCIRNITCWRAAAAT